MMNRDSRRRMGQRGPVVLNRPVELDPRLAKGVPIIDDPRFTHVKIVRFAMQFLVAWAASGKALKLEGWPDGCEVAGTRPYQVNFPDGQIEAGLEILVYHQDFPIVPAGANPPIVSLNVVPVEAEESDANQD